jgi:hypothetical protein
MSITIATIDDKSAPFGASAFLRTICRIRLEADHPVFTTLVFARIIILQSKAANSQSGGPGLCIYVP